MPRRAARAHTPPVGRLDLGPGWLFTSIRDAVLALDAAGGQVALANPAAAELFAYAGPEQLLGVPIDRLIPELRQMPGWDALRAGPAPAETLVLEGMRQDGAPVSVELTLGRVETPDARQYVVVVVRDSTERRQAEERRLELAREQAAQRRLAVLAEASQLLDASLDYEATLQEVARVAASTLADWCIVHLLEPDGSIRWLAVAHGDPEKEALARELQRRYPASLDTRGGVGRVLCTGQPEIYAQNTEADRRARARDPEHLRLLQALGSRSAMILPLAVRGRMLGALSLISSRPDRHYSPTDLVIAEELARRCAHAVENARLHQEAQTALRAREHFVAVASHELRTPIARVKGYAEMLQTAYADGNLPEEMLGRGLRRIEDASDRLAALVRDLLDVSRMSSGSLPLRPRELDVVDLLRGMVARCSEHIGPSGRAQLDILGAPPRVMADADRLEQVFQNLLDNAVKYSPEGAELRVGVQPKAGGVLIEFQDRGIGLPDGAAEQIFEPFGRAPNAQDRQIQGMGLGLYICRNIVEQHRGRIWARSDGEGQGTLVTVWLPQAGPTACDALAEAA
jgi:PAS domain S-box-containing protein